MRTGAAYAPPGHGVRDATAVGATVVVVGLQVSEQTGGTGRCGDGDRAARDNPNPAAASTMANTGTRRLRVLLAPTGASVLVVIDIDRRTRRRRAHR
jgi:hypothetical protein